MNSKSRTVNSAKNLIISLLMQLLLLAVSFASRTIFISMLGEHYLGINGLFSNILSVLSLADLGITTVMVFSMYKPIAENDEALLTKLTRYFKKIYFIISGVVLIIGFLFLPFLQFIVKDSAIQLNDLRLYFILYVINTSFTYLAVYKTTILNADQRIYIVKIIDFVFSFLLHAMQIMLLILTHNFIFYLVANIVITLSKNILLTAITNKIYPFLKTQVKEEPDNDIKKKVKDNIKSTFLYKVSATIINSTTNILISVILGTVVVGWYSNYLMIVTIINTFTLSVASAVLASIGNLVVNETKEKKIIVFRSLVLIFYYIGAFCSCCFITVFNDFMNLWIGWADPSYVLPHEVVYAITFSFFVGCVLNPVWMFREAAGLFSQVKYSMAFAAILNIIFSIILGLTIGLAGIIIAPAIAKLVTNFWYEPKVLFREIFNSNQKPYWTYTLKLLLLSSLSFVLVFILDRFLPGSILFIIIEILISLIFVSLIFFFANKGSDEFVYVKRIILRFFKPKAKSKN